MAHKNETVQLAEFTSRDSSGKESQSSYVTVAEVADIMRVSKMTVYRLVHSGEIPAVRFGRSFRVHIDQVNKYLENSYFSAG